MGMLDKDQYGFAALEGILIVTILAVIGFGGYYVWHTQKSTKASSTDLTPQSSPVQQSDPTANWKKYAATSGKFSLKYPEVYTIHDCSGDVLLGATPVESGT